MSDREQLLSFGFAPDRVDWALGATGSRGLQAALDFLVENESKPTPPDLASANDSNVSAGANAIATGANDPKDPGQDDDDVEDLRQALGITGKPSTGELAAGGDGVARVCLTA